MVSSKEWLPNEWLLLFCHYYHKDRSYLQVTRALGDSLAHIPTLLDAMVFPLRPPGPPSLVVPSEVG